MRAALSGADAATIAAMLPGLEAAVAGVDVARAPKSAAEAVADVRAAYAIADDEPRRRSIILDTLA